MRLKGTEKKIARLIFVVSKLRLFQGNEKNKINLKAWAA